MIKLNYREIVLKIVMEKNACPKLIFNICKYTLLELLII